MCTHVRQVRKRLPWFLGALPSKDCADGGAGASVYALQRSSKEPSGIKACTRPQSPFTHLLTPVASDQSQSHQLCMPCLGCLGCSCSHGPCHSVWMLVCIALPAASPAVRMHAAPVPMQVTM